LRTIAIKDVGLTVADCIAAKLTVTLAHTDQAACCAMTGILLSSLDWTQTERTSATLITATN